MCHAECHGRERLSASERTGERGEVLGLRPPSRRAVDTVEHAHAHQVGGWREQAALRAEGAAVLPGLRGVRRDGEHGGGDGDAGGAATEDVTHGEVPSPVPAEAEGERAAEQRVGGGREAAEHEVEQPCGARARRAAMHRGEDEGLAGGRRHERGGEPEAEVGGARLGGVEEQPAAQRQLLVERDEGVEGRVHLCVAETARWRLSSWAGSLASLCSWLGLASWLAG
eukprot:scaffold95967_cov63-Phaeocystis_antarctica.AAC.3